MTTLTVNQLVAPLPNAQALRIMSYNIRMAPCAEDDDTENAWRYRLPKINLIFTQYMPDIVGIQEVSSLQMHSLQNNPFDVNYAFIGKYPTNNLIESGLAFMYNTQKLLLVSDICTTWLNESQKQANAPAWDGSTYERYLIYAKFQHISTGRNFLFMTTHFDHLGMKARQESAKIIMSLAESLDAPAIITGDFNCFPQLGGQELYELLSTYATHIKDSQTLAATVFGVPGSWIGWDYDQYKQREGYAKYDFIFVHHTIKVLQHGIIDDQVWDDHFQKKLYPSDHRPVLSDIYL